MYYTMSLYYTTEFDPSENTVKSLLHVCGHLQVKKLYYSEVW